jgi:hypothetical protein
MPKLRDPQWKPKITQIPKLLVYIHVCVILYINCAIQKLPRHLWRLMCFCYILKTLSKASQGGSHYNIVEITVHINSILRNPEFYASYSISFQESFYCVEAPPPAVNAVSRH